MKKRKVGVHRRCRQRP